MVSVSAILCLVACVAAEDVNPYCSASFPSADTYIKQSNYDLVSVHLLTRHGDRAPLGESITGSQKSSGPAEGWKCGAGKVSDSNVELRGMSSKEAVKFNEGGVCSKDHLTTTGMEQLAEIGKNLRAIYKEQIADGIFVEATWTQRTYWSAVALMSGLLGSNQPKFKIHSKPLENDGLTHVYNKCKLEKKLSKRITSTSEFISANSSLVKVANDYGKDVSSHRLAAYAAVDNLRCQRCHRMALPPSTSNPEAIFRAMDRFTKALYFPTSRNATLHRMRIGNYLNDLRHHLQMPRSKSSTRFFYTSAHDATVSALLSSLGIDSTGAPPYASNFIIEVYSKKGAKSNTAVQFIYNGKIVHPFWCNRRLCSHYFLIKYLDGLGIHFNNPKGKGKGNFKEFDFETECDSN